MSDFDSFRPFETFLRPEKLRNGQERHTLRNDGRSKTIRNVGRSETFILYNMNGLKHLQNHFHVHALKPKESLYMIRDCLCQQISTSIGTYCIENITVILSFLKRERERTVNAP
jgi:hypothetical protein